MDKAGVFSTPGLGLWSDACVAHSQVGWRRGRLAACMGRVLRPSCCFSAERPAPNALPPPPSDPIVGILRQLLQQHRVGGACGQRHDAGQRHRLLVDQQLQQHGPPRPLPLALQQALQQGPLEGGCTQAARRPTRTSGAPIALLVSLSKDQKKRNTRDQNDAGSCRSQHGSHGPVVFSRAQRRAGGQWAGASPPTSPQSAIRLRLV